MVDQIDYKKSLKYWADIPATIDGVLGGFGFVSDIDIDGSRIFLKSLLESDHAPQTNTALDSGAGIGRITKYLLMPQFDIVDVVEPDEKFIKTLKDFVGKEKHKGNLYRLGLQEFIPERKYDVMWHQWVLGYLTDEDLVAYLSRCRNALTSKGFIIIKENVTSSGRSEIDKTDSSVTRTLKQFLKIFKEAKLKRIRQCKQTNFPNGLYPVYMFALVSMNDNLESTNDISKSSNEEL